MSATQGQTIEEAASVVEEYFARHDIEVEAVPHDGVLIIRAKCPRCVGFPLVPGLMFDIAFPAQFIWDYGGMPCLHPEVRI